MACELLADVVAVAEAHFTPWINTLFEDDRVEVQEEDGRSCLRRSPETYDLIVSDLFDERSIVALVGQAAPNTPSIPTASPDVHGS